MKLSSFLCLSLILTIAALLSSSCVEDEVDPYAPVVTATSTLSLSTVSLPHTFSEFDNPLGKDSPDIFTFRNPGMTSFYQGELHTFDGIKVPVFVALAADATIDRVLISINGGTGTDPRHFMKNHGHKAVVMVSMRGLHHDDIKNHECTLGPSLEECLRGIQGLAMVNPKDNGRDVVDVINIILGNGGRFEVDGEDQDFSFFGASSRVLNIETGSYGATILGYALARPDLPESIGRVFIAGPSSPSEHVITDGFRNTRVALDNLLNAYGFDSTEKSHVINVMKARHTAYNTNCTKESATSDCLSSAMIFKYLKNGHEEATQKGTQTEINQFLSNIKGKVNAIAATEATGGNALDKVNNIYQSDLLSYGDRLKTSWENTSFDLAGDFGTSIGKSEGFTSRIAQICSAYILRSNGDSLSAYNTAKAKASNDPYWYGFLHSYRPLLSICPSIEDNITSGIEVPSASSLLVEGLLQYGAGTDEKHHISDIIEMESYVDHQNVLIKRIYQKEAAQGGASTSYKNCFEKTRKAFFESPYSSLSANLDNAISAYCPPGSASGPNEASIQ